MEMEYEDGRRRGKIVIVVGVVLAGVVGVASFFLINQAQQQAGQGDLRKASVVVAVQVIPARRAITADDVALREVPLDPTNAAGVATNVADVIGRIPAVTILQGQLVTLNMLASTAAGAPFSILGPNETVGPDSEAWRAVSITVSDDLAVGGLLQAGQMVDVFVTVPVQVPPDLVALGQYYTDRSTKIVYQDVLILAREDAFYVVRASLAVAEELAHLQAVGTATFSFALRPDVDTRSIDASTFGETTNRIIAKYGIPIPETYPVTKRPFATLPPLPSPTPFTAPTAAP